MIWNYGKQHAGYHIRANQGEAGVLAVVHHGTWPSGWSRPAICLYVHTSLEPRLWVADLNAPIGDPVETSAVGT